MEYSCGCMLTFVAKSDPRAQIVSSQLKRYGLSLHWLSKQTVAGYAFRLVEISEATANYHRMLRVSARFVGTLRQLTVNDAMSCLQRLPCNPKKPIKCSPD